jgi:hypothetical protein
MIKKHGQKYLNPVIADGVGNSETKYNSINLSWHRTLEPKARPKII